MECVSILPPVESAQVFIDFDGTLSARDVLDDLIRAYSIDGTWEEIEREWQSGKIGSRQCLERQIALVRIDDETFARFLDGIGLDSGATELLKFLAIQSIPVTVLSDGIDIVIQHILKRHGVKGLPVRSNTIERIGDRMALRCPYSNVQCTSGSAHCKCSSAEAVGEIHRRTIYIGDGRSDLCAARKADFVFAKKTLANLLEAEGVAFKRYATLGDVHQVLAKAWQKKRVRKHANVKA